MARNDQATEPGNLGGTEDVRNFLQNFVEARQPRHENILSPTIPRSSGIFQDDEISSLHDSIESRVLDYGFRASVRNSRPRRPSHDAADYLGFPDFTAASSVVPVTHEAQLGPEQSLNMNEKLLDVLKSAMKFAKPDDSKTFLPLGELEKICQESVVRRELMQTFEKASPIEIDTYTEYICGDPNNPQNAEDRSRKIFAILVLIGKVDMIESLMSQGIKDKHLPFKISKPKDSVDSFALVKRTTANNREPTPLRCFNGWSLNQKRDFYVNQWRLLSPYFAKTEDQSVGLYELDEQAIMPWTSIGEEKLGSFVPAENWGGYAKVTQVTIHSDHHAFEAEKFAVKTLIDNNASKFRNEFRNLKRVETKQHLLPVYVAYRQGTNYSFLFPWADGGSMMDLWKTQPSELELRPFDDPTQDDTMYRSKRVITWIAGQLAGLTGESGLGFLHGTEFLEPPQPQRNLTVPGGEMRYGIHGDIKPGNILYFGQDRHENEYGLGLFKISDFGLTGFHSALTRSRQPHTGPHSPTYRAPEYGAVEAYLSRKYDIWGMGCVMLQLLTWLISGPAVLAKFDRERLDETDEARPGFKEDKFFKIARPGRSRGNYLRTAIRRVLAIFGKEPVAPKHNSSVENDVDAFKEDTFFKIAKPGGPSGKRKPKLAVQSRISVLQQVVGPGNYLYDCLDLIKSRILQINVIERADCREVHDKLQLYYERCCRDDQYVAVNLPTFTDYIH
ncbi:kinase-like domain-containing protein [Xylariaceae sp. FL1019]|nr:kinase-like domain-containing protein [Xylariaceae sp. FL1019]